MLNYRCETVLLLVSINKVLFEEYHLALQSIAALTQQQSSVIEIHTVWPSKLNTSFRALHYR